MCTGSKSKVSPFDLSMESGFQKLKSGFFPKCSYLLELAAADDVAGFVSEIEERGGDVEEVSFWYVRRTWSKKMGFEERTPLMVASMYGSVQVVKYIVGTGKVDLNKGSDSDGATALHCAAAGGSQSSLEIVKLLVEASADVHAVDANGQKPSDVIARQLKSPNFSKRKALEMLIAGADGNFSDDATAQEIAGEKQLSTPRKEYPVDISLPDINNGIYGTDEFRMYSFKVKPCSRAYSHDWTECPFVHPGENARRRDPRKYNYSCVPCPEFRKGSCAKDDSCEYAHGVFESWLHPAQYRTRLCKDETGCSRKVCFFAHKPEELRPLYASTGSAMPSPKSGSVSSMDIGPMSPLGLGSTPPLSPSISCSSPMAGSLWQSKVNVTPPALQLPGSRLKTALNARDLELELELLGMETLRTQQQQKRQQLIDDLSAVSYPWSTSDFSSSRFGEFKPSNLEDVFGALDSSSMCSQKLQGLSPKDPASAQLQSLSGLQINQTQNSLRSAYPSSNYSSSPVRKTVQFGFDSSAAVARAVMTSRSAAFAKRSQSFVDRDAMTGSQRSGLVLAKPQNSNLSDWGSPGGKLDWGFNGNEASRLKKSASFGFRSGGNGSAVASSELLDLNEPDVSWVNSLVKDAPSVGAGLYSSEQKFNRGMQEVMPPWVEQLYIEPEQMVA